MKNVDDLPLFAAGAKAPAEATGCAPLPTDRSETSGWAPGAMLFSPARNQRFVFDLADRFVRIRPGPKRSDIFIRRHLNPLAAQWRTLGLPETRVETEIQSLKRAIACQLDVLIYPEKYKDQA